MGGRAENAHPTVKPTSLMRWLVKLVSMPEGSVILDPFCGSGSTGVACAYEGQSFIGCEMDDDSADTAEARIRAAQEDVANGVDPETSKPKPEPKSAPVTRTLFRSEGGNA